MANTLDLQKPPPMEDEQSPSFSLPPYPQLIMEAIEACDDTNGRNKTAISEYIESTQASLPPSHATLLNYHLNQMKQSGQIVMVKNNYVKPDPDAPPKRGRGRPPKAKSQVDLDPAVSVSPTRPRGRPPKNKDSPSEVTKVPSGSGRPRGRPPKKAKIEPEAVPTEEDAQTPPSTVAHGERRGRGRPPKVKPVMVPVGC